MHHHYRPAVHHQKQKPMMKALTKTPLQNVLLFVTLVISILLQFPQPELDLDYYTSLALDHVNTSEKGKNTLAHAASPLKGVNIVITGATSGLGLDLTKALYNLGGTVIAIGRSESKLSHVVDLLVNDSSNRDNDNKRIVPILADLQDLDSVSAAADEIRSKFRSIDYLINNAGLSNGPLTEIPTPQGYDMLFGVNYLSHFLLTEKLLPNLKRSKLGNGSRVVQIASTAHMMVNGGDLVPSTSSSSPWASQNSDSHLHRTRRYSNSKLAQIYHTRSLARDLKNANVKVVALCPSWVATHIGGASVKLFLDIFAFRSDGWGLAPILFAMFHPDVGTANIEGNELLFNDYVTNCNFLEGKVLTINESIMKLVPLPFYRETCGCICGVLLIGLQKLFADVNFRSTASVAYDDEKQDALYMWSKEVVTPWM
jgi:NAD(P)-dependent dehydrogenase (short-subunit alcohol dehydrogenase family)